MAPHSTKKHEKKKDFDIFKAINEILKHIKHLTNKLIKNIMIDKNLIRLLRLYFESDNIIYKNKIKSH